MAGQQNLLRWFVGGLILGTALGLLRLGAPLFGGCGCLLALLLLAVIGLAVWLLITASWVVWLVVTTVILLIAAKKSHAHP